MLRNYTQRHNLVLLHGNHSVRQELVYVIQTCANRGLDLKVYSNIVSAMKIPYALTHLPNLLCKKTPSGKTLSIIIDNVKIPLASKINDCVDDTDIC